jgi:putative hydrolase of the HAD superfamily
MSASARRPGRKNATALLIAYDGVVWRHDDVATGLIEQRSGLPAGSIQAIAFAPVRSVPAMLGQVSRAAWCESIAAGLAERVGGLEPAEKIVEEWYAARGAVVPEVLDFIADVRAAGVPVGICVSGLDDRPDDLPAHADVVVDASEIDGFVPHPEFFRNACTVLSTLPTQCLYADVAPRNIAGARAAGLLAYRYAGVESLSYLREVFQPRA